MVFGNPTAKSGLPSAPVLPPEGYTDRNGWSFPGTEWGHVSPESEGFSTPRLDVLRAFLKTHQTDAMMVISRGHVVFEYGDTKLVSKVASVRKSVLDLLYAVEMQRVNSSILIRPSSNSVWKRKSLLSLTPSSMPRCSS
jgi:hypothetical protein